MFYDFCLSSESLRPLDIFGIIYKPFLNNMSPW